MMCLKVIVKVIVIVIENIIDIYNLGVETTSMSVIEMIIEGVIETVIDN
jgi:hypothetical protein